MIASAEQKLLAFYRKKGESVLIVLINMDKEKQFFQFDTTALKGNYKNVFTGESIWLNNGAFVKLEPAAFVILSTV
ncbi:MAG: hypothetical protein EOP47_19350 [Sphingobacteriaceae bacterium]|nr:MAG: hypothetical protein EOP47_19350 [Sphingobacteriaceae bacterium]